VKGETLMEYEITRKKTEGTKRTLTLMTVVSAIFCAICAVVRAFAGSQTQEFSDTLTSMLGVGIVLGLFVALLALNTRLQLATDEAENE
jgi:nitrogen fixation/metabolism regulation signal transduction histidine kinase